MNNIYNDIASRTNGDIYIGVVGPVRTGKSTFITQFMQKLILPNLGDGNEKLRMIDELPQSAEGKTVMTTQPKFVPNTAVKLTLDNKCTANVRLVDCVGYLVDGAEGHLEGDKQRLVNTPWSSEPIAFEKAAELGTSKVVMEHSTIAVVVTTDGSFGQLPRLNYVGAEERTIKELKNCNKPFVVVLNSKNPTNTDTVALAQSLQQKYGVAVLPFDCINATSKEYEQVLNAILLEFNVRRISVDLPTWMRALPSTNRYICALTDAVKNSIASVNKMKDCNTLAGCFADCEFVEECKLQNISLGDGTATYSVNPKQSLFFDVLSEEAKMPITDEYSLMSFVTSSSYAKQAYESMKDALSQADATGYGIVYPLMDKMQLDEPQMVKQGSIYGVRLTAKAPSYHIIKVDVDTQVSPMVGTEQQSKYLLDEYKSNPQAIWNTNMFGKTMAGLATEGLLDKCNGITDDIKSKLNKTLTKIVNENRGGLICFLL